MIRFQLKTVAIAVLSLTLISGCGAFRNAETKADAPQPATGKGSKRQGKYNKSGSILDAFRKDKSAQIKVNRFLWNASLDVLDFLPVQAADPFTGVITTGYGTPPGGGGSYRATILIGDPALDARSLNVALQGRGGRPVSAETQRAVEDAILARARQLRIAAGKF